MLGHTAAPWVRLTLVIHGFLQSVQKLVKATCIGGLEWWEGRGEGEGLRASGCLKLLFTRAPEQPFTFPWPSQLLGCSFRHVMAPSNGFSPAVFSLLQISPRSQN